jgi:hypothetical protein
MSGKPETPVGCTRRFQTWEQLLASQGSFAPTLSEPDHLTSGHLRTAQVPPLLCSVQLLYKQRRRRPPCPSLLHRPHTTRHYARLTLSAAFQCLPEQAAVMESQQQMAKRTLPRRGQVKARIFASLFRCLFPKTTPRKEEVGIKSKEGGGRRVTPGG